jgi:hypothetical protein
MKLSSEEDSVARELFVAVQMLNTALTRAGELGMEVKLNAVARGINVTFDLVVKMLLTPSKMET